MLSLPEDAVIQLECKEKERQRQREWGGGKMTMLMIRPKLIIELKTIQAIILRVSMSAKKLAILPPTTKSLI